MNKLQKGFIVPLLLLLLLIAILVVGGGVYFYSNKKIKTPTIIDTNIQQTNQDQKNTTKNVSTITPVQIATNNSRRLADLSNIRGALIMYSDNHTTYPVSSGATPQDRWASLGKVLVSSKILSIWGQDPNQQNGFSYDYRTSPDWKSFVLKADMELDNPESLKIYDPRMWSKNHMNQGVIFGMDCNGTAFCDSILKGSDNGFK